MGNKKTDTYDVIYSSIRRITKLRTAEGEIRFTATMKLIYAYIWTFQENKDRGNDDPIHTNTNVFAWEIGVSEKALIDALKALDAAKVVIKGTEKVRGNVNSSNYVAIPPASVSALGITPPHPNESKSKPKKKKVAVGPTGDALHHGSATGTDEPTNEEKKGDDESYQGNTEQRDGVPDIHSDQHDDVSANDAVNGAESERWETPQRADIFDLKLWREEGPSAFGFMEYGANHGEAEVEKVTALIDQHYFDAFSQITIFDENGVVTEEFINGLSRGEAPKRNDDGTLQKYGFAYAMAQAYQAHREGKSEEEIQRGIPVWIEAALPEYIPVHLQPKPEPVSDYSERDFSMESIPF